MSEPAANIGFVSLGCPKATVDSERILSRLRAEGYRIVPSYDEADVVVVNTCGFIDAAIEESLDAIGEALNAGTNCGSCKPELAALLANALTPKAAAE